MMLLTEPCIFLEGVSLLQNDVSRPRLVLSSGGVPVRILQPAWLHNISRVSRFTSVDQYPAPHLDVGILTAIAAAMRQMDQSGTSPLGVLLDGLGCMNECGCCTFGQVAVASGDPLAAISLSGSDHGGMAIFRLPADVCLAHELAGQLLQVVSVRLPAFVVDTGVRSGARMPVVQGDQSFWPEPVVIRMQSILRSPPPRVPDPSPPTEPSPPSAA